MRDGDLRSAPVRACPERRRDRTGFDPALRLHCRAVHRTRVVASRPPALAVRSCSHPVLQLQSGIPVCKNTVSGSASAMARGPTRHDSESEANRRSCCQCAQLQAKPVPCPCWSGTCYECRGMPTGMPVAVALQRQWQWHAGSSRNSPLAC